MALALRGAFQQLERWGYIMAHFSGSLVGRKRPLLGGVKLTHRCNLACVQCPFRHREQLSLSFERALSSLRTLREWGVRICILEGGEPLLWRDGDRDINDLIAEAKRLFFTVGVTTNGTFPIEIDPDIVWVSIDGLGETHDRLRGRSFERIMANIAASRHPQIYAHLTVNSTNWQEIPDLVEYLASRVKAITLQFHYPFEEVDEALFLPFEQRREVLDQLIGMKREGFPLVNSTACLEALKDNSWRCRPWLIASVDPDGGMTHGCYLLGRGPISCERCGFSAHTEISLAYGGHVGAALAGAKIFFFSRP